MTFNLQDMNHNNGNLLCTTAESVKIIRESSPVQRKSILEKRRLQLAIVPAFKEFANQFAYTILPEVTIAIAHRFDEQRLAKLFRIFAYMSVPMSKNSSYHDSRNADAMLFFDRLAQWDFSVVTTCDKVFLAKKHYGDSSQEQQSEGLFNLLMTTIEIAEIETNMTEQQVAALLADILIHTHRTIQQTFTTSLKEIAESLVMMHNQGQRKINDLVDLSIVIAIANIDMV